MASNYSVTSFTQRSFCLLYSLPFTVFFGDTVFSFHICQSSDADFKGTLPQGLLSFHNFFLLSHHAWCVHKYQYTSTFRSNNKFLVSTNTGFQLFIRLTPSRILNSLWETGNLLFIQLLGHFIFWTVAKNKVAIIEWKFLLHPKFHEFINQYSFHYDQFPKRLFKTMVWHSGNILRMVMVVKVFCLLERQRLGSWNTMRIHTVKHPWLLA